MARKKTRKSRKRVIVTRAIKKSPSVKEISLVKPYKKPIKRTRWVKLPTRSKIAELGEARARIEIDRIRSERIKPRYSLISPLKCKEKRRQVRRDYFAIKATGGLSRRPRVRNNKLTVIC